MLFGLAWVAVWIAAFVVRLRPVWVFPAIGLGLLVAFREEPAPWRLAASSLFFLYLMKAAVLARQPSLETAAHRPPDLLLRVAGDGPRAARDAGAARGRDRAGALGGG